MDLGALPENLRLLAIEWAARLVAALIVLAVGLTIARWVRKGVVRLGRDRLDDPDWIGRLVYVGLVAITLAITAQQAGLETLLFNRLLLILFAALVLSVSLAFGLGARAVFESHIARYHYERLIRPGDRVRVGDAEGVVVRYTPVAIIVSTRGKELLIPCRKLQDGTVELERVDGPVALSGSSPPDDSVIVDDQAAG